MSAHSLGLHLGAVSRSYRYRKVMKPLLERKRRARINKCLDELKQLIMEVVQLDVETLSKLEKADILELTVHHLHRQRKQCELKTANNPLQQLEQSRGYEHFWCGFQQCILDVSWFLQRHDRHFSFKFLRAIQQLLPVRQISFWRPW
ncbi:enhancer of split mgamma protein [Drosophila innubila]|uniref:enhancer of split mgamma protein n=1 Tax=Drosophila innubila TaxID=198719 RepID=UPI00148C94CF|nr:enhancer of split mgamma protein [Drosophila innubila]